MTTPIAAPLERRHMPADYRISLASYTARGTPHEQRIPSDFGPTQSLRGFDPIYRNIIDYIVRITYRIWEEREVGYIRETYDQDSQVFDDYGLQLGAEKIVRDTTHTTSAFSDIKLIADEIIWAGDDTVGFHTSHRTIIRGTNDGDSKYGPATHKHVDVWCIANCVARDNKIFLEHVLYNNSSLLLQLGKDLRETAVSLARDPPAGWSNSQATWAPLRAAARPPRPLSESAPVSGFDVDAFARSHVEQVWNRRNFTALGSTYAANATFHGPSGRAFAGRDAYRDYALQMLEAFPDLITQTDEVYWMGNDAEGYLASVRWSAIGTHGGSGLYGKASGRPVRVWGITQYRIVDGQILENWTMFNELNLMMQLSG